MARTQRKATRKTRKVKASKGAIIVGKTKPLTLDPPAWHTLAVTGAMLAFGVVAWVAWFV